MMHAPILKKAALALAAAGLMADPLTLHEERRLARHMSKLITLTTLGGHCLGWPARRCTTAPAARALARRQNAPLRR